MRFTTRSRFVAPRILFALALATIWLGPAAARAATPVESAYDSIIPRQQSAVAQETADVLSSYVISATLRPESGGHDGSISGDLHLHYVNSTSVSQSTVYLRLYPNSPIYPSNREMTVTNLTIAGTPAAVTLSVENTVVAVAAPAPVAPGGSLDIALAFTSAIPTDPSGTYGMYQFDSQTGVYALANWFPILAGYDPVHGWLIDPPATIGDPVFGTAALYNVRFTAPAAFKIAAGGTEAGSTPVGLETEHRYASGPVRDFVIAASDRFKMISETSGATTVTVFYLPSHAPAGADALTFGARALRYYDQIYGQYPYKQFSLVETPLGNGASGVEFPQLVFLETDAFVEAGVDGPFNLEFLIAHETAHQWFYGLVGNDQYLHAFMDEALANFSALQELDHFRGPAAAQTALSSAMLDPYQYWLGVNPDLVVDSPSEGFPSVSAYNAIVYGKAVLGFNAIESKIGQTKMDAGLTLYVANERFKVAAPSDLLASLNQAAGKDLTDLWNYWFEQTHGLAGGPATPASGQ